MKFRPCIDIHSEIARQIVGGSLRDSGDQAAENFVSGQDAAFYARLYQQYGLSGGHVILLNPAFSEYYGPPGRRPWAPFGPGRDICSWGAA